MNPKLILSLQIGGFAVALIGLFVSHTHWYYMTGFGVHVVGDYLAIKYGVL